MAESVEREVHEREELAAWAPETRDASKHELSFGEAYVQLVPTAVTSATAMPVSLSSRELEPERRAPTEMLDRSVGRRKSSGMTTVTKAAVAARHAPRRTRASRRAARPFGWGSRAGVAARRDSKLARPVPDSLRGRHVDRRGEFSRDDQSGRTRARRGSRRRVVPRGASSLFTSSRRAHNGVDPRPKSPPPPSR